MQLLNYSLGEILEKWAFETPDAEFMVYPDRDLRFTYSRFNKRVNSLAKGLLYLGVQPGNKIAIWAKNVPDWTTLFFASAKIGAVLVPVKPTYNLTELEFVLKDADIHSLFLSDDVSTGNFAEIIHRLIPTIKTNARERLNSKHFPKLRNVVFIGQKKQRGMYNTAELILLGSHIDEIELESAKSSVDCHNVATIQYTRSGETFLGAMLSHQSVLNSGHSVGECMKYTSAERLLLSLPLSEVRGNVLGLCSVVAHGATLVFAEDFTAYQILVSMESEKCTAIYGTSELFNEIMSLPEFNSFKLTSLRAGILFNSNSEEKVVNNVQAKMHLKDLITVYGTTESSGGITATRPHNPIKTHTTTIGFELPNVEVKIVNTKTGELCDAEEQGEICCRGYNVMKGYYKNRKASEMIIDKDGWLHTGNLGVKTTDGFFRIIK